MARRRSEEQSLMVSLDITLPENIISNTKTHECSCWSSTHFWHTVDKSYNTEWIPTSLFLFPFLSIGKMQIGEHSQRQLDCNRLYWRVHLWKLTGKSSEKCRVPHIHHSSEKDHLHKGDGFSMPSNSLQIHCNQRCVCSQRNEAIH